MYVQLGAGNRDAHVTDELRLTSELAREQASLVSVRVCRDISSVTVLSRLRGVCVRVRACGEG